MPGSSNSSIDDGDAAMILFFYISLSLFGLHILCVLLYRPPTDDSDSSASVHQFPFRGRRLLRYLRVGAVLLPLRQNFVLSLLLLDLLGRVGKSLCTCATFSTLLLFWGCIGCRGGSGGGGSGNLSRGT